MKSAGETLFLFDYQFQNYHWIERQRPYTGRRTNS